MSWTRIVLILIGVALATGLLLGATGELTGWSTAGVGVGASVGAVGGILVARKRASEAPPTE